MVTGGAGHIGSHVVDRLVRRGDEVVVVDDLSTGSRHHLAASLDRVELVTADVRDPGVMARAARAADVVFHLGATVGVRRVLDDPAGAAANIVDGARAVQAACARSGARLVVASSSEVYGDPGPVPMREDGPLGIGDPSAPRWSYALAKALTEQLVLHGRPAVDAVAVRYFNSYGPRPSDRGRASVVATFVRQALDGGPLTVHGDGAQVRCFTYVDDLAAATIALADAPGARGLVVNVGQPRPTRIADVARQVRDRVDPRVGIVHVDPAARLGPAFVDPAARIPSIERLRRLTDWRAATGWDAGLAATVRDAAGHGGRVARSA